MPVDGTFPVGYRRFEKRNIADIVPVWEHDFCIQCGQCGFVCPHSVIRAKYYDEASSDGARSVQVGADQRARLSGSPLHPAVLCRGLHGLRPVRRGLSGGRARSIPASRRSIWPPKAPIIETERANITFFEKLPFNDRARVDFANVRGVQFLQPLFEFSGACAGCGETPYLKLLSQLFGDRLQIANATGCSSIYGGNLPTTPWTKDARAAAPPGPTRCSRTTPSSVSASGSPPTSTLEIAHDAAASSSPAKLGDGPGRTRSSTAPQISESELRAQRDPRRRTQVEAREDRQRGRARPARRSSTIWCGAASGSSAATAGPTTSAMAASITCSRAGRNVNVLVLDTEVYSNTGGQASKATPLGAVAKFATAGKRVARKDLALQAIAYGNVYVAQVAMGANPQQTLRRVPRGGGLSTGRR